MEFRRELIKTELLDPRRGFEPAQLELELRWDPLTGHTSRILPPSSLVRPTDFDVETLAAETRPTCPFCPERIERVTPKLASEISESGRIRRGEAVLFPNLLPYSKHSSVSVYSPERHLLRVGELTPALIADNLATQVEFAQAVTRADPGATWSSINANHLLPSGSSVFHPHLQGSVNPFPTTMQRLLAETPADRFAAYVEEETRGPRHVASTGRVDWLAAFAPIAPAELRAFVARVASPAELGAELVEELGDGIARALGAYADRGFQSFNLALYGAPLGTAGYPLNLRLVARSNLEPLYRSDATWLERLHWEAAVDVSPEELAEDARGRF